MTLYPPTLIELSSTDFSVIPIRIILVIIYVIIGVTFMTYLLTVYGLKYVSPSVSSAYIYLQPILVILFAYVLSVLGIVEDYTDTITWEKVVYMIVIFIGVYITSSSSYEEKLIKKS